ncbi:germin-like protein [Silene latifolia]|uniref:germin-like protein n=1 Tax=Silene latifolia TaxID=37657 RepID=UPI003D77CD44
MAPCNMLVYVTILVLSSYVTHASDLTPLQDFCVGVDDPNDALFVNGRFCKNPMDVTADDFLFKGLLAGNTNTRLGSHVTLVNATVLPGLNTLGISLARVDIAPGGLNGPHIHPRGTQVQTMLEGTLFVGFVTSDLPNGENKFFTKVLNKGDVFVSPQGLIHFELNIGDTAAVSMHAFSSQNPGVMANSVFGANPPIRADVLSKAFDLDEKLIKEIQSRLI